MVDLLVSIEPRVDHIEGFGRYLANVLTSIPECAFGRGLPLLSQPFAVDYGHSIAAARTDGGISVVIEALIEGGSNLWLGEVTGL